MTEITAVCVSREPQSFNLLPFVSLANPSKTQERGTVDRAKFVADLRNQAMKQVLIERSSTTHVLMVDSYYLHQTGPIRQLLDDYEKLNHPYSFLGASTWIFGRLRLRHPYHHVYFYDTGATPEGTKLKLTDRGIMPVSGVGACYIFPVEAWVNAGGFRPREDKFQVEHLSIQRGHECFLDLNAQLWRHDRTDRIYSWPKMVRIAAGDVLRRIHVK